MRVVSNMQGTGHLLTEALGWISSLVLLVTNAMLTLVAARGWIAQKK